MKNIFIFLLIGYSLLLSQTKTWKQSTAAEFSLGAFDNVVVTNNAGGELQLIHPLIRQKNDTLDSTEPKFVSYDDAGNYVSGWITGGRVYAQKFNPNRQPLTTPILVDDSGGVFIHGKVGLALLNNGKFVVGWRGLQQSIGFEVRYIQFFDAAGAKIGTNIRVFNIINGTGSIPQPIADRTNERYVILTPEKPGSDQTYPLAAKMYSADGIIIRDSIDVVPAGGTVFELNPDGEFRGGKLALAWEGNNKNYGPGDIYTALYDSNCVPLTPPIKLVEQRTSPAVTFDGNGNWMISWVWLAYVAPGPPAVISAQVLNASGEKIGGVIQVSDLEEGSVNGQNLFYADNMFKVAWTKSFSDGRPEQQWASYWKLEQITNGSYISSVFDGGSNQILFKRLSWDELTSSGMHIKFQLRSSISMDGIQSAQWLGPASGSDFYTEASGENIGSQHNVHRYVQAKALFQSFNVGMTPVLNEFTIAYTSSDSIPPQASAYCDAQSEHRRIVLEWAKSTSADVKTYRVYRALENGNLSTASFIEVNAGTTSFVDSQVVYNKKYRYGVTAVDSTLNESAMKQSPLVSPRTMTIFVSAAGSVQGPGTVAHPFSKISDAIKFSGEGDTVFVLPGEYSENITLKNGTSLIGSNPSTTKILSSIQTAAVITGSNIAIKGFTFLVAKGIQCGGANVLVTENIFIHQGTGFDPGITAGSYENVVISKNILMNFSLGIQGVASLPPSTVRTIVRNNIIRCPTGVQNVRSNMAFFNNTFIVEGSTGIAVSLPGGRATMMNNCFAGYPSEGGFVRSLMSGMDAVFSFQYNNRWNLNGDQPDTVSPTNISVDPQFMSVSKNNFHFGAGSQCIDKGNPAPEYNDVDGSRNDIGAYGGPDPLPGTLAFSLATDLSLSTVSGFPGDTVVVAIVLSKAAGVKKAMIDIRYDHAMAAFLAAVPAPLTRDFSLTAQQPSPGKVSVLLNGQNEIPSGSGTIASLKFILDPAAAIEKRSVMEIGTARLYDGEENQLYVSSVTNASCVLQMNTAHPHKVFVDGNYNGAENGTMLHPYSTVQEGINHADAGDTVIVAAGNYIGPVSMRSDVMVMGLGANVTRIECPDDPFISIPTVIRFQNVQNTGITGCSLVNHASLGTVIEVRSSSAVIAMNKIDQSGMAMYTVIGDADSRVVIKDNYFVESKYGGSSMISLMGHDALVTRNIFSPTMAMDAIELNAAVRPVIINNRFYLPKENMTGILAYNSKNALVANNLFSGGASAGSGIKMLDAESTLVVNNIFDAFKTGLDENGGAQRLYNNIFIGSNTALSLEQSTTHQYNLFWNNTLNFAKGTQDPAEIMGNPYFADRQNGNYRLLPSSPAVNAGHPDVQWYDNDGTRNDIGLYGGPYADTTMFVPFHSRLRIGNVPGSPGDTLVVPIYALGIAGISGVQVMMTYDPDRLSLIEAHTTPHTSDFVLSRKHIGNSMVDLQLQGYRPIMLDSGAVMEVTFVVNVHARGNIPLKFQHIQFVGVNTQIVTGILFENGEITLGTAFVRTTDQVVPKEFALHQNFPNPFNPSTVIRYSIPRTTVVRVKIFDILGREIKVLWNEEQQAGMYQLPFDASGLASGMYFYQLQAGDYVQTKKMLLLK